jgi:hypothetical protein
MSEKIYIQKEWDASAFEKAEQLVADLQKLIPESHVYFTGALALKIAGKNDIDISVDCGSFSHERLLEIEPTISAHINQSSTHTEPNFVQWEFGRDEIEYDIVLYNNQFPGMDDQMKIHDILSHDTSLCAQYQELKNSFDGKPYEEYRKAKIAFFNKTLGK